MDTLGDGKAVLVDHVLVDGKEIKAEACWIDLHGFATISFTGVEEDVVSEFAPEDVVWGTGGTTLILMVGAIELEVAERVA